ncbi:anthranilate phosphoribosyltransferase [Litoreibacter janthinus]|uniref:Anthranilate phosphoribosyltransferase n=1 Tax=Litoreibacter janthinus TaxID=670154 RepID=A0A1I6GDI6_9RHOB|nr:anthranilate phosphoribosyltransferase [Litoreibacter janthinus]SFR40147.1 anthranilate phosphoribosyltransferase [Litoreibacter janthinus]
MKPDQTAAAVIAGNRPAEADMIAYWEVTDSGLRPKAETVAVLAALSANTSNVEMMRSFVSYIRKTYPPIALDGSPRAVNIVGTGGGRSTFNISTTAAFVVAAAGGRVLKSGSSAYSSSVGSGDILSALGLAGSSCDAFTEDMLGHTGMAFASATRYAPICKRLAIAAMPLNFKIIGRFVNALGPMICPYEVRGSVVGTSTLGLFDHMHKISSSLGIGSLIVHSEEGVDELLSVGTNRFVSSDSSEPQMLYPTDLGLQDGDIDALTGGDLHINLAIMKDILRGKGHKTCTQTVALNAGAALYAGGFANNLQNGTDMALECLADGAPYRKLEQAQAYVKQGTRTLERVA